MIRKLVALSTEDSSAMSYDIRKMVTLTTEDSSAMSYDTKDGRAIYWR